MSEAGEQACAECGHPENAHCVHCSKSEAGDQVKRVTVEEARQNMRRAITVDGFERHLAAFEAAVREDERERVRTVLDEIKHELDYGGDIGHVVALGLIERALEQQP